LYYNAQFATTEKISEKGRFLTAVYGKSSGEWLVGVTYPFRGMEIEKTPHSQRCHQPVEFGTKYKV